MNYPIAEIFHSIQGEGFWTGTPMMFVRLAGCNVGQYTSDEKEIVQISTDSKDSGLALSKKHSICTTFDGQRFLCDTDYHYSRSMSTEEIVAELKNEAHVCITGGEPFLHNLQPLIQAFTPLVDTVHIETSGSKPIEYGEDLTPSVWITLCPKAGVLEESWGWADEVKLLVGPDFNEAMLTELEEQLDWTFDNRYLQPINGVEQVWQENLQRCLSLLERWPHWKLSAQLHKFIGVR